MIINIYYENNVVSLKEAATMKEIISDDTDLILSHLIGNGLNIEEVRDFTEDRFVFGNFVFKTNLDSFHNAITRVEGNILPRLMNLYLKCGKIKHADHLGSLLTSCSKNITFPYFFALIEWMGTTRRWTHLQRTLTDNNHYFDKLYKNRHSRNFILLNNLINNIKPCNQSYDVISLISANSRQAQLKDDFFKLGILNQLSIFPGVDGSILPYHFCNSWKMTGGAFGATLSHISLLEKIVNTNQNVGIIFEDDARLLAPIPEQVIENFLISDLDILWLNERRFKTPYFPGSPSDYFEIIPSEALHIGKGLESYVIKRNAAERLINYYSIFLRSSSSADIDNYISAACIRGSLERAAMDDKRDGQFYRRTIASSMNVPSLKAGIVIPYLVLHYDMGMSTARPPIAAGI